MSVLELRDVRHAYRRRDTSLVHAVDGVSLTLERGEILGLVGETGCGKSTLARVATGVLPPTGGEALFNGEPIQAIGHRPRPRGQRRLQLTFQDSMSSLNPRRRVGAQIRDATRLSRQESPETPPLSVGEALSRVGLSPDAGDRFPHEFSGGQRQRISIARALAAQPLCIVADEPIASLDASAQAEISNLLMGLVHSYGIGLLFISHDLAVVREIADRTGIMYLGRLVENGPTEEIWKRPAHPYSDALIKAVPRTGAAQTLPQELPGEVPDPANRPSGCHFNPRCAHRMPICVEVDPKSVLISESHSVACHLHPEPAHANPSGHEGRKP